MKTFVIAAVAVLCVAGLAPAACPPGPIEASVQVNGNCCTGSGVVVVRGPYAFVWTAGHVVRSSQEIDTVIDPKTGLPRVRIGYKNLTVRVHHYQDGRLVRVELLDAKVLRFSYGPGGEDLALLRLFAKGYFTHGVAFLEDGKLPQPGDTVWHIGSAYGEEGHNSVSRGVFSTAGRLRDGNLFDQVTVTALHGCSGGGVFDENGSRCLGLLTEGVTQDAEAANYIVPARRIRKYARRTGVAWAVDASVPMPCSVDKIDGGQITDVPVSLPDDWKRPEPTPTPSPGQPAAVKPPTVAPELDAAIHGILSILAGARPGS